MDQVSGCMYIHVHEQLGLGIFVKNRQLPGIILHVTCTCIVHVCIMPTLDAPQLVHHTEEGRHIPTHTIDERGRAYMYMYI